MFFLKIGERDFVGHFWHFLYPNFCKRGPNDLTFLEKLVLVRFYKLSKNHYDGTFFPLKASPSPKETFLGFTQPAITCSKLIIEPLEQGVKYVQNWQLKYQHDDIGVALVSLLLILNIFHISIFKSNLLPA